MYAGRDFSPFDTVEDDVFTFDFAKHPRLAEGEIIESATWFCTVAADSPVDDENADDHIDGSAEIDGTKVLQRVNGLMDGVIYVLQAAAVTDGDNTISLWAHVEGSDPR